MKTIYGLEGGELVELIREVDEGGYKYLGVLQDCRVMNE